MKHLLLNFKNKSVKPVRIIAAMRKVKTGEITVITEDDETPISYILKGSCAKWSGYHRGTPHVLAATEGTEYKSWGNRRYYRLRSDELKDIVNNQLFSISFP